MPSHAQDWRNRAALARSFGDMPTADWCDEQADHHDRLATSIARLEAITDCLKGSPDHSHAHA
jgi:hypothetical protein